MILHHFNPRQPGFHWLLSAGDLCLGVVMHGGLVFVAKLTGSMGTDHRLHTDEFRKAYGSLVGRDIPFTVLESTLFDTPAVTEWMYFTDLSGKSQFILHTSTPAFLCPFSRSGDRISIFNPIADHPPIPDNRLEGWLDLAASAAKDCLQDLAK